MMFIFSFTALALGAKDANDFNLPRRARLDPKRGGRALFARLDKPGLDLTTTDPTTTTTEPTTDPTTTTSEGADVTTKHTKLGASSRFEVAYLTDCAMGSGYDSSLKLCKSVPLDYTGFRRCDEGDVWSTCFKTKNDRRNNYMTSTVSDEVTRQTHMNEVVEASGSGWGVSASTSVSYTGDHMESSYGVSYFIGQSTDQYYEEIQNPVGMKLSAEGKRLLQMNPQLFLDAYGKYYVAKIIYGAAFTGSVTVSQKENADSSALEVLASLEVDGVFGMNGKANNDYKRTVSENKKSLSIIAQARYDGYTRNFDGTMPESMGDEFQKWVNDLNGNRRDNTVPLRMVYRPWYDIAEVQAIVNNYGEEWIHAFSANPPNKAVQDLITKEYMTNMADKNTLRAVLGWNCISGSLKTQIQRLLQEAETHGAELDHITDDILAKRTTEVMAGNYAWFKAWRGDTIKAANEALSKTFGCKSIETTGTVKMDWTWKKEHEGGPSHGDVHVKFPSTCSNCIVRELSFRTDKFNVMSVEAKGNDIGMQVLTARQSTSTVSMTIPYAHSASDHKISCPTGKYMTGLEMKFGQVVPWKYQTGVYDAENLHTRTDLKHCAWSVRDGRGSDKLVMWSDAASSTSDSWGCRSGKPSKDTYHNENWNVYRVNDILLNYIGNVEKVKATCKSLPPATYGLPSGKTFSPDVSIANVPKSTLKADCPSGSVLAEIKIVGQASWDPKRNPSIGPNVKNLSLKCRKLSDYTE